MKPKLGQLFNKVTQCHFLKVYSLVVALGILPIATIAYFAVIVPYIAHYGYQRENVAYEVSVPFPLEDWIVVAVPTIVVASLTPLIILAVCKLFYKTNLAKLPEKELYLQLFYSTCIPVIMTFGAAVAVSDPIGWGLIASLFYVPLVFVGILTMLIAALGTGRALTKTYKSNVFQMIPLLALILTFGIYVAALPMFDYMLTKEAQLQLTES